MKTVLACIILCIAALIFGKRQNSRIAELEQRLAATEVPVRMERPGPDHAAEGYRSKYRQREASLSAAEVFDIILPLVKNRSVSSGSQVVMENREAFQAVLKLDLAGQQELISLIATSNDPRLGGNGRDTLHKCEQINVCLIAMADQHPETALEYLRNCDERIGKFYQDWMTPDAMISYTIRRLCEHDPATGINELVAQACKSDPNSSFHATDILVNVAESEPELVLETIPRLPVASRVEPLRRILEKTDSNEECTRRFQSLRNSLRDDPAAMDAAFSTLLGNVTKRNKSWRESADWVEALNLSNEERIHVARSLVGVGQGGVDGHPEPTQWLAGYLPPSKERSFILWHLARRGMWGAMDPHAVDEFLRKNSIDEAEMKRLAEEKFLYPH